MYIYKYQVIRVCIIAAPFEDHILAAAAAGGNSSQNQLWFVFLHLFLVHPLFILRNGIEFVCVTC